MHTAFPQTTTPPRRRATHDTQPQHSPSAPTSNQYLPPFENLNAPDHSVTLPQMHSFPAFSLHPHPSFSRSPLSPPNASLPPLHRPSPLHQPIPLPYARGRAVPAVPRKRTKVAHALNANATNNHQTQRKQPNIKNLQHPCQFCDRVFERRYNLKVHMRRHTGETPYECPIETCKKAFKWRSSMAHHIRSHRRAGINVQKKPIRRVKEPKFDPNAITTVVKTTRTKPSRRSTADARSLRQHLQRILERNADTEPSPRPYATAKDTSPPPLLEPLTPEADAATMSSGNYNNVFGNRARHQQQQNHQQQQLTHQQQNRHQPPYLQQSLQQSQQQHHFQYGENSFLTIYLNDVEHGSKNDAYHSQDTVSSAHSPEDIHHGQGTVNELLEAAQMHQVNPNSQQPRLSEDTPPIKTELLFQCESVFTESDIHDNHPAYWNNSHNM